MFCGNCGSSHTKEAKFCSSCGHGFLTVSESRKLEVKKFPAIVAAVVLVIALFSSSLDIGFFTFLRWVVTGASAYYLYYIYKSIQQWNFWTWTFILLAIIFNPLVPLYLDKDLWQLLDLIALIFFLVYFFKLKKT